MSKLATRLPDRDTIIACFQQVSPSPKIDQTASITVKEMAQVLFYYAVAISLANKCLTGAEILATFEREIRNLQQYGFITEDGANTLHTCTSCLIAALVKNREVREDALRIWKKAYGYLCDIPFP